MRLDGERLQDMLDAIAAINRHRPADEEDFLGNELVRVWCLRHLEIIGEAASKVSEELRRDTPEIPWKEIVGMRNVL